MLMKKMEVHFNVLGSLMEDRIVGCNILGRLGPRFVQPIELMGWAGLFYCYYFWA